MAGDWIPIRIDLREDPAVIQMAIALDSDEDLVVGKLARLWGWANRQCANGNAHGVTKAWIDRYVGRDGFAQAMIDVAWLEASSDGIAFPKFESYNSQSAKTRLKTAKRAAKHRSAQRCDRDDRNAASVTKRAPTRTEEKRREEKSIDSDDHRCVSWLKNRDRYSIASDWCKQHFRKGVGSEPPLFTASQATESRKLLLQVAAIALCGQYPEAWVAESLEAMRRLTKPPDNPGGYLRALLRASPHIRGRPDGWFDALLKAIEVPES